MLYNKKDHIVNYDNVTFFAHPGNVTIADWQRLSIELETEFIPQEAGFLDLPATL
jgi:hypothetical protein